MQQPPSAGGAPALDARCPPAAVRDDIARRAGDQDAPVSGYFYRPAVAARQAERLRAALPDWVEVFYAVKANSFPPVVEALAPYVHGFEVASTHEAELVNELVNERAGGRARLIVAGPGKSRPLLARLVELGVEAVNVESILELHRLADVAAAAGRRVAVTLRVNPRRLAVRGSLAMGGVASQFGLPEDDIPAAVDTVRRLPALELLGFHVHAVCNNLDAAAHAEYVRGCLDWSVRTARKHGTELRVVDAGGGLGVPFEGEDPFDVELCGALLATTAPPHGCRVLLEPGRFLVTDCGWYTAEVIDLKRSYGIWFAVVRGGINAFQLPISWDIVHRLAVVPVERWSYPCARPEVRDAPVTVVGELCTPEDTLARDVRVGRLRAGDVIVFPMAGSYGWEFAMPDFLGHPRAQRVAIEG